MVKNSQKSFYTYLILTILYAAMIFYLSSRQAVPQPSDFLMMDFLLKLAGFIELIGLGSLLIPAYLAYLHLDKLLHAVLFTGFGFLAYLTINNTKAAKYAPIFVLMIGAIYAVTDEVHQSFVVGRTPSSLDFLSDVIGILFAIATVYCVKLIKAPSPQKKEYDN